MAGEERASLRTEKVLRAVTQGIFVCAVRAAAGRAVRVRAMVVGVVV